MAANEHRWIDGGIAAVHRCIVPYSLVSAQSSGPNHVTFEEIRELEQHEFDAINEAIRFCRRYAARLQVQLVYSGHESFLATVDKLSTPMSDIDRFATCQNTEVGLVSFLLLWRLCIDHIRHDLSERFGRNSPQFVRFEEATHREYDNHAGYRLIEGLRNYVQHVALPGLQFSTNIRPGASVNEQLIESHVRLPVKALLTWDRCPASLRRDLQAANGPLAIVDLVKDAIAAFDSLVLEVVSIDQPEKLRHLTRLQDLVSETSPGAPVLVDFENSLRPKMLRFDDLFRFLFITQEAERTT